MLHEGNFSLTCFFVDGGFNIVFPYVPEVKNIAICGCNAVLSEIEAIGSDLIWDAKFSCFW
jgi:hypothetical protein